MAGFDNPLKTWNARFAREDFSCATAFLEDYDAVIQEGQAHNGLSALIDLVARKS